jgi:hypothetical protein
MAEEVEKVQHPHGEFADQDIVTGRTSKSGVVLHQDIVMGRMSKSGVVLRPQPTNDPNEPLVK